MTVRFGNYRLVFYVAVLLLSATVLGLAAHFASLFLPSNLHHDFTIFALIVPSLTIFVFLLTLQWAQPRIEAVALFILGVLWLAMGAWSADVIGNQQCDILGSSRTATKDGDMSAREYCYEMKVIEAFSWMNFVLFAIAFIILISLVNQAQRFGRRNIWEEPIRDLGWFGEYPGYYNQHDGATYPTGYQYPQYPMNGYNAPPPGHSLIIQPSHHGQPTTVTTIPYSQ